MASRCCHGVPLLWSGDRPAERAGVSLPQSQGPQVAADREADEGHEVGAGEGGWGGGGRGQRGHTGEEAQQPGC